MSAEREIRRNQCVVTAVVDGFLKSILSILQVVLAFSTRQNRLFLPPPLRFRKLRTIHPGRVRIDAHDGWQASTVKPDRNHLEIDDFCLLVRHTGQRVKTGDRKASVIVRQFHNEIPLWQWRLGQQREACRVERKEAGDNTSEVTISAVEFPTGTQLQRGNRPVKNTGANDGRATCRFRRPRLARRRHFQPSGSHRRVRHARDRYQRRSRRVASPNPPRSMSASVPPLRICVAGK
jgi:hypothetical protein